jgi:hypothetical protein
MASQRQPSEPRLLLVRGDDYAFARRWLRDWQGRYRQAEAIELGLWDRPHRNTWVNRLNHGIAGGRGQGPAVVVAEGLACLALAWWADYEPEAASAWIKGALLIDPPAIDLPECEPRLAHLPPPSRQPLPFAAIMLATRVRDEQELRSLWLLARDWRCNFDTVGGPDVLRVPSPSPVQSLGQHFLNRFLGF